MANNKTKIINWLTNKLKTKDPSVPRTDLDKAILKPDTRKYYPLHEHSLAEIVLSDDFLQLQDSFADINCRLHTYSAECPVIWKIIQPHLTEDGELALPQFFVCAILLRQVQFDQSEVDGIIGQYKWNFKKERNETVQKDLLHYKPLCSAKRILGEEKSKTLSTFRALSGAVSVFCGKEAAEKKEKEKQDQRKEQKEQKEQTVLEKKQEQEGVVVVVESEAREQAEESKQKEEDQPSVYVANETEKQERESDSSLEFMPEEETLKKNTADVHVAKKSKLNHWYWAFLVTVIWALVDNRIHNSNGRNVPPDMILFGYVFLVMVCLGITIATSLWPNDIKVDLAACFVVVMLQLNGLLMYAPELRLLTAMLVTFGMLKWKETRSKIKRIVVYGLLCVGWGGLLYYILFEEGAGRGTLPFLGEFLLLVYSFSYANLHATSAFGITICVFQSTGSFVLCVTAISWPFIKCCCPAH
jgi:hypothetical protein